MVDVLLDEAAWWVHPHEGLDKHLWIIIPEASAIIHKALFLSNCRIFLTVTLGMLWIFM